MNFIKRTLKSFSILSLLIVVMMALVSPQEINARKKSTSKAKTTAVSKSKKSKTSKASSKKSKTSKSKTSSKSRRTRRTTGASRASATSRYTAPVAEPEAARAEAAVRNTARATAADSKRKIKVEKPDLDEIRSATLDPKSNYYFPTLKKKYEVNDTTMTPEEFRHFYLGYMFQEDFDPYRVSPYSEVTEHLRNKPTHTREEIDTITKYALLSLEDNPFDLRQMSFLVHVLKERRKDMRAKIWEYRLENLLGAIKSTGTGDSIDNAWYVIYPVHEYDMVQLLGYEAVDAKFFDPGVDYLEVRPDAADTRKRDKSAKGFYFNVEVPQQQYELKHPEEVEEIPAGEFTVEPEEETFIEAE